MFAVGSRAEVTEIKISEDGSMIVIGTESGRIFVHRMNSPERETNDDQDQNPEDSIDEFT